MYIIGKCYSCNEVSLSMQLILRSARDCKVIVCSYHHYSYFRLQDRGFGSNNLKRFVDNCLLFHRDTLFYEILR